MNTSAERVSPMSSNDTIRNVTYFNDSNKVLSSIWGLEYSLLVAMITFLSLVGVVGNTSVLIVYFRRRGKLATNTFIKVLACIDLLVCSFLGSFSIVYELHLVQSDIMCRLGEFFMHFVVFASNITLVGIATERYIAVCRIDTKFDLKSISRGVWVIFGISSILAAPAIGTFAVVHESEVQNILCDFPHVLTPGAFCHFTYTVMGRSFVVAYQALQIIIFFVTVSIIIILYSIIYYTLWKKYKIRRNILCQTSSIGPDTTLIIEQHKQIKTVGIFNQPCSSSANYCRFNASQVLKIDTQTSLTTMKVNSVQPIFQVSPDFGKHNTLINNYVSNTFNATKLKLGKMTQGRRSTERKRKTEYHNSTAKMLFLCTVIYIMCWIPFWIDIFGLTNSLVIRYMFLIGNATNPIVYGIVNEQVRRAFKQLFSDCGRQNIWNLH